MSSVSSLQRGRQGQGDLRQGGVGAYQFQVKERADGPLPLGRGVATDRPRETQRQEWVGLTARLLRLQCRECKSPGARGQNQTERPGG